MHTYLPFITVFSPLLGFLLSLIGYGKQRVGAYWAQTVTIFCMVVACLGSFLLFLNVGLQGDKISITLLSWIKVDALDISWGIYLDSLSVVMILVVTLISTIVHLYSVGYMHGDRSITRFMGYLSLFTFFMMMLVVAPNAIQLFFGWEGVGVASYLLIGFWYEKPSACAAAMKAFIVNRVADLGLILGLGALFMTFQTLDFVEIFAHLSSAIDTTMSFLGYEIDTLILIGILLFIGAMGKSAQLFLHTWLPDAMEGPTPVSALIHAATMVTAGIFLVCRFSPLYELAPAAREMIIMVGLATAFFAGTVACVQNDIKRVIAYSTCSQLGYMFVAAGLSAYSVAMFHLYTHAFFKALLFLGAGSVIHALSDEQDLRRMGGLYKAIPFTYTVMWIGTLAIVGFPYLSGYYSKHQIFEAALTTSLPFGLSVFWGLLGIAFITAFYSGRLIFMAFHGKSRADETVMGRVHESPLIMTISLTLLALGAIFSGNIGQALFIDYGASFWQQAIVVMAGEEKATSSFLLSLTTVAGLLGLILAGILYTVRPQIPDQIQKKMQHLYTFLLEKWYFDQLYEQLLIKPAQRLGRFFWKEGDERTIDRLGPDGITATIWHYAQRMSLVQTGYIYHYAFGIIVGLGLFITLMLLGL